jgi:hypothetical protein
MGRRKGCYLIPNRRLIVLLLGELCNKAKGAVLEILKTFLIVKLF